MGKKQKAILILLILLIFILLVAIGGYLLIKTKYPLEYQKEISRYAEEYGLDPYLVCAVIWTESKFDPDAYSQRGAIGLMQIMPETGEWIAGKLDIADFETKMLYDPQINIRFGCWYLGYLSERFDGDVTKICAGYNAGPNKVDQWLEDPAYSSDGITLDLIPYEETKNYVEREQSSYEIYKVLYTLE